MDTSPQPLRGEQTPRRRVSFPSSLMGSVRDMNFAMSKRKSRKTNFITGESASGNTREQIAMFRPREERRAMGRIARKRVKHINNDKCFTRCCNKRSSDSNTEEESKRPTTPSSFRPRSLSLSFGSDNNNTDEEEDVPQYTLESRRRVTNKNWIYSFRLFCQRLCYCCCSRTTNNTNELLHSDNATSHGINHYISSYFSWSFRTSYGLLFIGFAIFYYGFILLFTLFFYIIALTYPECINSAGHMIGDQEGARRFSDCFQLSWTTFSTVGYGVIYPSSGASDFHVGTGCVGVGFLGSFEAFLGVLYAGFCGAILFSKVLRSQNTAQVFFSDPIVVRYGKMELYDENSSSVVDDNESKEYDEENGEEKSSKLTASKVSNSEPDGSIPCPSLEFRLVNRLHDVPSGEIVEAKLDCVAILDPKVSKITLPTDSLGGDVSSASASPQHTINEKTTIEELAQVLKDTNTRKATRSIAFHSSNSKQPHMFTKLGLDAEEHPYFRRVWFGRHRLDENSPLLTPAARNRVKLAGGYWPEDMNNYKSVKESIHFRHLLICISGVSNANAASVYAQKVYDLVDVNVGYRFVPMIYRNDEGALKTDSYLLNAVYQQRGGGAEPFQ